jgi:hypothetical protein
VWVRKERIDIRCFLEFEPALGLKHISSFNGVSSLRLFILYIMVF